jgi:predicted HTH transcriptional regulator
MIANKLIAVKLSLFLGTIFFCSCGGDFRENSDDLKNSDETIKILWNTKQESYLLFENVAKAPSGELRIEASGKYLDMSNWEEKEVLESELKTMKLYER